MGTANGSPDARLWECPLELGLEQKDTKKALKERSEALAAAAEGVAAVIKDAGSTVKVVALLRRHNAVLLHGTPETVQALVASIQERIPHILPATGYAVTPFETRSLRNGNGARRP